MVSPTETSAPRRSKVFENPALARVSLVSSRFLVSL